MKTFTLLLIAVVLPGINAIAQTNTTSTDTLAAQIMQGCYNPAAYIATTVINNHDSISRGINARVSPDSKTGNTQ